MIDVERKIAEITLKKLTNISWSKLSLDDVLVKNIKKKKYINTKNDLLKNLNRYVDSILVEKTKYLENSTTKDMLFEVLMMRFDILQQNRISFIKIYENQVYANELYDFLNAKSFKLEAKCNFTMLDGKSFQEDLLFIKKKD